MIYFRMIHANTFMVLVNKIQFKVCYKYYNYKALQKTLFILEILEDTMKIYMNENYLH